MENSPIFIALEPPSVDFMVNVKECMSRGPVLLCAWQVRRKHTFEENVEETSVPPTMTSCNTGGLPFFCTKGYKF